MYKDYEGLLPLCNYATGLLEGCQHDCYTCFNTQEIVRFPTGTSCKNATCKQVAGIVYVYFTNSGTRQGWIGTSCTLCILSTVCKDCSDKDLLQLCCSVTELQPGDPHDINPAFLIARSCGHAAFGTTISDGCTRQGKI